MSPRKHTVDATKGVLEIEWPFFGELSRGLALKVARAYDPEIVIGIATAGVIPGAVIAAILRREFHSLVVSRKFHAPAARETPQIFGTAPKDVRGKRVLIVDETATRRHIRLAVSAVTKRRFRDKNGGQSDRRIRPDFQPSRQRAIFCRGTQILIDGSEANPLVRRGD